MSAIVIWDSTGPPWAKKSSPTSDRRAKRATGKMARLRLEDTPKPLRAATPSLVRPLVVPSPQKALC